MELPGSGYNLGYKAMWKRLWKVYGLIVKQKTVMQIMEEVGSEGVKARTLYRKVWIPANPYENWSRRRSRHNATFAYGLTLSSWRRTRRYKKFSAEKSTHNQRIETYRRQFRQHMDDLHINFFKCMECGNLFNINNIIHCDFINF